MSTAELAHTLEHLTVVTPDSNGGPVNGVPVKRGEQLLRRHGSSRGGTPADTARDLLEEFAATVAHELRTPLAIVELAADTVLERTDQLEPDQLAGLPRIIQHNTRLATVLSNAAQVQPTGLLRLTRPGPRLRSRSGCPPRDSPGQRVPPHPPEHSGGLRGSVTLVSRASGTLAA